ncbi:MAG TPA: tetratricopeptide repeat protein [Polyangiaceae bacterium]|nr:tetratricopeptide repeat protein [Polyangiaceae bacterium]
MAPRPSSLARLSVLLLVPALALSPVVSWAAKKKADASAAAPGREYSSLCTQGNAKYAARDYDGAIELYRKAIERSPHQGLGYYLLGEAQLASGSLADAEASWTRAALEVGEKDPSLRAKVLFVTADLKERQKKWEDAKAAWQTYLDWANRFPDAGVFPASAQSRLTILDTVIKQDKAYEIVRQRIAATADGGVFSDPSKSPPAK